MASILKKLLSYGSQKAPAVVDDVVDTSKVLTKRGTTIPTEVGPQVLGKGKSELTPDAEDILDAQIITKNPFPYNASSQLDLMKKLGLTGAAAGTAVGVANMMDEDEEPSLAGESIAKTLEGEPSAPEKIKSPLETKQEALKPKAIAQEEQAAIPQIAKEQAPKRDLVEEALQRARENKMAAAIQRATTGLGAAIASTGALTKITPDREGIKALEEEADRPIEELKFKQEQEKVQRDLASAEQMTNPDSDISKMTRSMLSQVGLGHLASQKISAQDLKNAGIDVDTLLAKKIQMDQTAALKTEASLKRRDDRMADMAARLAPKIQNKQYQEMVDLNNQVKLIEHAAANPNPQNDAAIIYSFIKTLDPGSAVKEGEIEFTEAGRSIPGKLRQSLFKGATGQVLLPEERQNILNFAKQASQQRTNQWKISASPYIKQAEKLGIPQEMIIGDPSLTEEKNTVSKSPETTVIIKRKSDGVTTPVEASVAERILRTSPDKYERVD